MATSIATSIEKTPGICGGDARVRNTRIAVWLLVGYRKDGVSEWYYAEHHEEIEAALREQE